MPAPEGHQFAQPYHFLLITFLRDLNRINFPVCFTLPDAKLRVLQSRVIGRSLAKFLYETKTLALIFGSGVKGSMIGERNKAKPGKSLIKVSRDVQFQDAFELKMLFRVFFFFYFFDALLKFPVWHFRFPLPLIPGFLDREEKNRNRIYIYWKLKVISIRFFFFSSSTSIGF